MKKELSNCCEAELLTDRGDEGTCCWICVKCKKPCDRISGEKKEPNKECNCVEMICKGDCSRKHTHKGFFCQNCRPEAYKGVKEEPKDWEALREKLADIEHQRWADWQKYANRKVREEIVFGDVENILEHWDRQVNTPYSKLSEKEKDSDREQVDRYLPLIKALLEED